MTDTSMWTKVQKFHQVLGIASLYDLDEFSHLVQDYLRIVSGGLRFNIHVIEDIHTQIKSETLQTRLLRIKLLLEEVAEYLEAEADSDKVEIADALADIHYIAAGTEDVYGFPGEAIFTEVHRSNMSKFKNGTTAIFDKYGKLTKSENYSPPDIAILLKYSTDIEKALEIEQKAMETDKEQYMACMNDWPFSQRQTLRDIRDGLTLTFSVYQPLANQTSGEHS